MRRDSGRCYGAAGGLPIASRSVVRAYHPKEPVGFMCQLGVVWDTVSNTRLYGAAIAVAPGGYALWSVSGVSGMDATAWAMALVGVVANLHGVALDRLRSPDPGEWPPHGRLTARDVAQAVMGRGMQSTDRGMGLDGSVMAGGMVGRRHGRARAVDARERARHESGESVDDAGR